MTEPTYNLLDEPWIGAVDQDGMLQEYNLRELLIRAHELRALYDDSPLVVAALLRMILALLHRVHDGPRNRSEWQALWQAGKFDVARLDGYFDIWHDQFDLFGTEHPFYQATDAGSDGQEKPISTLLPERATGNNATLFDHTTDASNIALSCAEAARVLIAAQSFGLAGPCNPKLKLYFTDGTAARGIIFMAEGNTLFESLVLNLIEYPSDQFISNGTKDRPAWEMDSPYYPEREFPLGYLDYLTWQNRRILFIPQKTDKGVIIRKMALTPGLRLDASVLGQDPMKHYRIDDKRGRISKRFSESRALWRDSATLLQFNTTDLQAPAVFAWLARLAGGGTPVLEESLSLRYMALGMASNKAKVEFFRSENLPLPIEYLDNPELIDLLSAALSAAENVASELWKASGTMASVLLVPDEDSERRANPDDVKDLRASMGTERRYWAMLEPHFRETMQALPREGTGAMRRWFDWLRDAAWEAFDEISDGLGNNPRALKAAIRGRERLARGLAKYLRIQA